VRDLWGNDGVIPVLLNLLYATPSPDLIANLLVALSQLGTEDINDLLFPYLTNADKKLERLPSLPWILTVKRPFAMDSNGWGTVMNPSGNWPVHESVKQDIRTTVLWWNPLPYLTVDCAKGFLNCWNIWI